MVFKSCKYLFYFLRYKHACPSPNDAITELIKGEKQI